MFFALFYFLFTYFFEQIFFLCNPELTMILLSQCLECWNKRLMPSSPAHPFIHSFSHSPLYLFLNEVLLCNPGWLHSQSSCLRLQSVMIRCLGHRAWASPYMFQIQGPCSTIGNRDGGGLMFLFWIKWFGEVGWVLEKLVVLKSSILILTT